MPRDGAQTDDQVRSTLSPVAWHCAQCGHLVTRQEWAISMNGAHEHVVFNPAGIVFRIVCFAKAPGTLDIGPASDQFSWFKGYDWRLCLCGSCRTHLGWTYAGAVPPAGFHGLIRPRLVERPQ